MQLPVDLNKAFEATCKSQNRLPAQVIRELMRVYVKKNSMSRILNPNKS